MVEESDTHQSGGAADPLGQGPILGRRGRISGRVVVEADDAGSGSEDRLFEDFRGGDMDRVDRSYRANVLRQNDVPGIKGKDEEMLPMVPSEPGAEKFVDVPAARDGRAVRGQKVQAFQKFREGKDGIGLSWTDMGQS